MNRLADLPNQKGFRFVGITHDGEEVPCVVRLDPMECYSVYREEDGAPFWFSLSAWRPALGHTKRL